MGHTRYIRCRIRNDSVCNRLGRRGGGVILYIKESIQAYEIKLEKEAECEEAVWCNIVTGNSTLTVGLVYRSPNISMEENEKIHNAIKEVSKRDCIIMGDFNHVNLCFSGLLCQPCVPVFQWTAVSTVYACVSVDCCVNRVCLCFSGLLCQLCMPVFQWTAGHIQWTSLQSTGREDQEFLNLVQDSFLSQHVLEATRGENVLDIVLSSQNEFVDNVKICEPLECSDHN